MPALASAAEGAPPAVVDYEQDAPPAPSEAEACEAALADVHDQGLAKRLEEIRGGKNSIAFAIEAMKASGAIRDALGEKRVMAKLTIGDYLTKTAILSEAIYQAFETRFKSKREVEDALLGFRQISTAKAKTELIYEIMERVLQYIPEISAENVNRLPETAAFLGMNQSQMQELRDRWLAFDEEDRFAELLQGGILAALMSADKDLVDMVLARSGWIKRKFAGYRVIAVPAHPRAINPQLTLREIQLEDRSYYADDELGSYLTDSSPAARLFFIMSRLTLFTRAQLDFALERQEAWGYKVSLIQTLESERAWREELSVVQLRFATLARRLNEATMALKRAENQKLFDDRQVQQYVGKIRQMRSADQIADESAKIFEEIAKVSSANQYVNSVISIIKNATPLLGSGPATVRFVDLAVNFGNLIGLTPDAANKLQMQLVNVADRASGREAAAAKARAREVAATTPEFENFDVEQLQAKIEELTKELAAARDARERVYKQAR